MKTKFVMYVAALLVVAIFSCSAFAAERVVESLENGRYIIKTNDRGVFWIDDNVHNRRVQLTGAPVGNRGSGVYEIVCGDQTRRIVNNGADLAIILQAVKGFTWPTMVATWAGKTIYNELCEQFKP